MAKYIDAEGLKKRVTARSTQMELLNNEWSTLGVLAVIEEEPAARVDEITRCQDCIYCRYDGFDDVCTFHRLTIKTTLNDYCSHAKRKV